MDITEHKKCTRLQLHTVTSMAYSSLTHPTIHCTNPPHAWKENNFLFYRYRKHCTIARKEESGCPSKIANHVHQIVELRMRRDNETTATQIHELLVHNGISISLCTVLRCREKLGWTFRGSAYCQLIREANKQKRLEWALQYQTDQFDIL